MVGVVVRGQHAGDRHAVGLDGVDQVVDGVGRVDEHALAGGPVADGVDEVDHLLGDRVVDGEVAPRQQLAEVQAVGSHRATVDRVAPTRRRVRSAGGRRVAPARSDAVGRPPDRARASSTGPGRRRGATASPVDDGRWRRRSAAGDRLVVVQETGDLLHVPAAEHAVAGGRSTPRSAPSPRWPTCTDEQITAFFERLRRAAWPTTTVAGRSPPPTTPTSPRAAAAGRSTTRLVLTTRCATAWSPGCAAWRDSPPAARRSRSAAIDHDGWSVEARRAPLGVVGFVFEGRPNVFADATGVLRTGNTVVFRIGQRRARHGRGDRRRTRSAPALAAAGLPAGAVSLVDRRRAPPGGRCSPTAAWRSPWPAGPAPAVAQLGAVARQAGMPVSLHGTGGAWLVAGLAADADRFRAAVAPLARPQGVQHAQRVLHPGRRAPTSCRCSSTRSTRRPPGGGHGAGLHVVERSQPAVPADRFTTDVKVTRADGEHVEPAASTIDDDELATEWEWEHSPEVSLVVDDDVDEAVALCNRHSPRFVASLVSDDAAEHERFYAAVDAPVRRRRLHPLGRRPVRPRHARARPVQLAGRPAVRPRRRAVGRLGVHRPPPGRRSHDPGRAALMRRWPAAGARRRGRRVAACGTDVRTESAASAVDRRSAPTTRRRRPPRRRRPSAAAGRRPTAPRPTTAADAGRTVDERRRRAVPRARLGRSRRAVLRRHVALRPGHHERSPAPSSIATAVDRDARRASPSTPAELSRRAA